jgi:hypothetical protein
MERLHAQTRRREERRRTNAISNRPAALAIGRKCCSFGGSIDRWKGNQPAAPRTKRRRRSTAHETSPHSADDRRRLRELPTTRQNSFIFCHATAAPPRPHLHMLLSSGLVSRSLIGFFVARLLILSKHRPHYGESKSHFSHTEASDNFRWWC